MSGWASGSRFAACFAHAGVPVPERVLGTLAPLLAPPESRARALHSFSPIFEGFTVLKDVENPFGNRHFD